MDFGCTSNHTKIVTGAGNVSSVYVPCDTAGGLTFGGSFDLNFPKELGVTNLKVSEELKKDYTVIETKDLSDALNKLRMPITGLFTRIEDNRIIKERYEKGLLWGSTCIYELLKDLNPADEPFEGDLLEERVYVAGKLEQIIIHNTIIPNDKEKHTRVIWVYTFPNPRSGCYGTNGSNEPCTSTLGSSAIGLTAGSADIEFGEYNLQLLDANYEILMRSIIIGQNTRENTYYKDGKTWVWCETENGIITGSLIEYDPQSGEYRPRNFAGRNTIAPNFPEDLEELLHTFDNEAGAGDFV